MCEHKNKKVMMDPSLNFLNAAEKGYKYVDDIPDLYKTLNNLLEFAEQRGYKLGLPNKKDGYYGLYSSVKKK